MASNQNRRTFPNITNNATTNGEQTGTTVGGKNAADVAIIGDSFMPLIHQILLGNQPEPNYNKIIKSGGASATIIYEFQLDGVRMFLVQITNADTVNITIETVEVSALTDENADALLLESGMDRDWETHK